MEQFKVSELDFQKEQNERLKNIEILLTLSKTVLNREEVCKLTGLSKSTIYKLTHFGRIPFYKKAKHLFFDRVEVENWLKSNKGYSAKEVDKQSSTYVTLNKGRM